MKELCKPITYSLRFLLNETDFAAYHTLNKYSTVKDRICELTANLESIKALAANILVDM